MFLKFISLASLILCNVFTLEGFFSQYGYGDIWTLQFIPDIEQTLVTFTFQASLKASYQVTLDLKFENKYFNTVLKNEYAHNKVKQTHSN